MLVALACAWISTALAHSGTSGELRLPPTLSAEELAALSLDQRFSLMLRQGQYLDAMGQVEAADQGEVNPSLRSIYRQYRPTLDGFVVPDPDAPLPPDADAAELAAFERATAQSAIEQIVQRARDRRIVIINEAHDSPRDRAFILEVAEALRPLGFTHYAAETLTNFSPEIANAEMSWLEQSGYPRRSSGTYSIDPMFAFLLRRVLALGYRPVAYEIVPSPEFFAAAMNERIALREQAQAENLARAMAAAGPDAKFLVHVGYSHAGERPLPPGDQLWMAGRLAALTGQDPLTIDQTTLAETAGWPQGRALHAVLASGLDGPSIFVKDGAPVMAGMFGRAVDLQVVHPRVTTLAGRPDWLARTGRLAIPIPQELLPGEGRRLVQAFADGEADDAIPLDQALVTADREAPVIYVPEDVRIRWAVQD
jgi:hypothetical protein